MVSVWSRLFGKNASPAEQSERAAKLLEEAAAEVRLDPKKTRQRLGNEAKALYDALRVGGPHHEDFRKCMAAIWLAEEGRAPELPTVEVVPWDTWPAPMMRDVAERARATEKDVVYCTSDGRGHRSALAELDALRILAEDAKVAMVVVGEEDMFLRRSFLLHASQVVKPDSEDLGQDLDDAAKEAGFRTEFLGA